ncbi:MAG: hypothetical protein Q4C19_04215, partial [Clostridiaceae bacterium]|nr:hypothetical protein [Clostridiaceae bacterium]
MSDNSYDYSKQDGYYGSKEDYYDADGNCYNFICNSFFKNKGLENKNIKLNLTAEKRAKLEKDIKEYFNERSNKELNFVNDQIGTPTYTFDLARLLV